MRSYWILNYKEIEDDLISLIYYFEGHWISHVHRNMRRKSNCSKNIRDCYNLVSADLPRTNNSAEE